MTVKLKVLVDGMGWIKHNASLDYMDAEDIRTMASNWVKSNNSDWVIEVGGNLVSASKIISVKNVGHVKGRCRYRISNISLRKPETWQVVCGTIAGSFGLVMLGIILMAVGVF